LARRQPPKRTPARPPANPAEQLDAAIARGHWSQALDLADAHAPVERLAKLYLDAAEHYLAAGHTRDARDVLDRALKRAADRPGLSTPEWLTAVASGFARAGEPARALGVIDPPPPAVLAHVADFCLVKGDGGRALLPEAHRPAFDAVCEAFARHQASDDDAARAALQNVGLTSPFLEWKLLVRGLIAYAASDDARAAENWQRLDPQRLPARLVAPLRLAVDPAFRSAVPPEQMFELQRRADRLTGDPAVGLRSLQASIGHEGGLAEAFRQAAALLPQLRAAAPDVVERLARCFAWAVITHGSPDDVPRLQRVFGPPPDDPGFDRLRAIAYEQAGEWEEANAHWRRFDLAIQSHPERWPGDLGRQARAFLWEHMAANFRKAEEEDAEDDEDDFFFPFGPAPRRRPNARRKPPPLETEAGCLARSLELAPDRVSALDALVRHHIAAEDDAAAEAAGRRLLERDPDHVATLTALARLAAKRGDAAMAVDFAERALRVNPLDRTLRTGLASARLVRARAAALAGDLDAARADFAVAAEGAEPAVALYAWAVAEEKAGDPGRAAELRAKAGNGAAAVYWTLIESHRLKAAPAVKKAAEAAYAALLAAPPTGADVVALARAAADARRAGVEYRGYKTHDKKAIDWVEKAAKADLSEAEREAVCEVLFGLELRKPLKAHADAGRRKHRANPFFPYYQAEAGLLAGSRYGSPYRVVPELDEAARLARARPENAHYRELLERIARRRQETMGALDPFGFFDRFFDRGDER
jgi:tetratricopeptide (TPR) repeat protein